MHSSIFRKFKTLLQTLLILPFLFTNPAEATGLSLPFLPSVIVPPGVDYIEIDLPSGTVVGDIYGPFHGTISITQETVRFYPNDAFWDVGTDFMMLHSTNNSSSNKIRWIAGRTAADGPLAMVTDPGTGSWRPWVEEDPFNRIRTVDGIITDFAQQIEVVEGEPSPRITVILEDPASGTGESSSSTEISALVNDIDLPYSERATSEGLTFLEIRNGTDAVVAELKIKWNNALQEWHVWPTSPETTNAPTAPLNQDFNTLRLVRWTRGTMEGIGSGTSGADFYVNDVRTANIEIAPFPLSGSESHELLLDSTGGEAEGLVVTFENPRALRSGNHVNTTTFQFFDNFSSGAPSPNWSFVGMPEAQSSSDQGIPGPGQQLDIDLGQLSHLQSSFMQTSLNLPSPPPLGPEGYAVRFWFDPTAASLPPVSKLTLFSGCPNTVPCDALRLRLENLATGLQLVALAGRDNGSVAYTIAPITNEPHLVELRLRNAVAPDLTTGYMELWIDGVLAERVEGIKNHNHQIDVLRFGAIEDPPNTTGTISLDEFESWRFE